MSDASSDDDPIKKRGFCTKKRCLVLLAACVTISLATALAVVLVSDHLRGHFPPEQKWWQKTIVYQIYPRSFQDSDDDGIGDLKGIISRLDYFKELGVSAIWISPIYESPMKDFGYDISNFTNIDKMFGTLDDFDDLIEECHDKGLRVIMDFVPNHTSDQHPWFKKSVERIDPYTDYYIWTNSTREDENGKPIPPNNWLSIFGGSAWAWNVERQQFYYHAFIKEQVDLNYNNPAVREEMKNVVRFWAQKGIDGFRVDAISTLFETTNLTLSEPRSNANDTKPNEWEYLDHPYTYNYPGVDDVIQEWRKVLDEFDDNHKSFFRSKFMVVEIYMPPKVRNKFYKNGADMPFNMDLVDGTKPECDALCMKKLIAEEYDTLPEGEWPNFVMGNHDRNRITSKRGNTTEGKKYTNALNMLLLTLRGTPTTYYGDELGMEDLDTISYNDTQDPFGLNVGPERYQKFSRDPERTPMQWSDEPGAGFTNFSEPWLPINDNYNTINVEVMNSTEITQIKVYQKLAELRQEPSFLYGRLEFSYVDTDMISYVRKASGYPSYLVVINVGTKESSTDFSKDPYNLKEGTVVVSTGNIDNTDYGLNKAIKLKKVALKPAEGLVIKLS
ncbi:hypothetical protein LOTGIDRAFT_141370 [Lottia gigantea]|uniref:Glycosyl hydrolase family 13 catalytic domain-containing protein n=1 Tax=Lottia gigantea TaxID=225164 RepID=V4A839_LOTGI|nr:hypothetical protein LOTGIDRAFT_141370 [Lottia gigantea]ESP00139.1 hypothetical protein LOTGIDRAFT_141370 [Lottia gigantea]